LKECKNLKLKAVAKSENKIKYIEGIPKTLDGKMKDEKPRFLSENTTL